MTPSQAASLQALLSRSTPFIRIEGADRDDWCRVMQDQDDKRIGPWRYVARFTILDQATWDRAGEVLYFVTDAKERVRLVGQSMSSLKTRWRMSPMFDVQSKASRSRKALFHTTSWPAIEAGLESEDPPPFTVSALFRDEIEAICKTSGDPLSAALEGLDTHHQRLSYRVESWVCSLDFGTYALWNKQKVTGNAVRIARR